MNKYIELKSKGICTSCGVDYATTGKTQCDRCRKKSRLDYSLNKEKRLKQKKEKYHSLALKNLCPVCGCARDDSYKTCSKCRNKQRLQRKKRGYKNE